MAPKAAAAASAPKAAAAATTSEAAAAAARGHVATASPSPEPTAVPAAPELLRRLLILSASASGVVLGPSEVASPRPKPPRWIGPGIPTEATAKKVLKL